MAAWEITKLWTSKEIGEYRAYVAAQIPKRVGNQRCTCEDLSLRLISDFAEANKLPIAIANNTYPKRTYIKPVNQINPSFTDPFIVVKRQVVDGAVTKLAHRHGLTPEDFMSKTAFDNTALTSTGASDLLNHSLTKFVAGAVKGKAESLALATAGDLIVLGKGGSHVQVVTSVGNGVVNIMQGNFRPDDERASGWSKFWGTNQNDPNEEKYIGAIVAGEKYTRERNGDWHYKGGSADFAGKHGRVMLWDFDAWNALMVQYTVQANDTLSSIALKHWGNGDAWKRIWWTNQTKIGSNPDKLRAGMKLFIWK